MNIFTPEHIHKLGANEIFVFGSNLAGRHGAGAALLARKMFGAQPGVGEGITGQCYAIPTKDADLVVRSLDKIRLSVDRFIEYSGLHGYSLFLVTPIGCGLAGYAPQQIAPMFRDARANVILPQSFLQVLYPA